MEEKLLKQRLIGSIEGTYSLGIMYLKKYGNDDLKILLSKLENIEDKIESCSSYNECLAYSNNLNDILKQIEEIINE